MNLRVRFAAVLLSAAFAHTAIAQTPETPGAPLPANEDGTYTLHIYPTLFQVPTLVLPYNAAFPITQTFVPSDFKISVDEGPEFQPITARREGEDPLDLAILLDASGRENRLLANIAAVIRSAVAKDLHPQDQVAVYAIDCKAAGTPLMSAMQPELIERASTAALSNPELHGKRGRSACDNTIALWDTVTVIVNRFPKRASRRVLLLVSEGIDGKSKISFDNMLLNARLSGVTAFAIRDGLVHDAFRTVEDHMRDIGLLPHGDPLGFLTSATGGKVYDVVPSTVPTGLDQLITDLRNRYILEFEAPEDRKPGEHRIDITINKDRAYTRAAPVTAAIPDPAVTSDPTFIHTGAHAPTFGTKPPKPQ